jgi:two-component system cell cycle sensor histidine kinase/response regulator CckA
VQTKILIVEDERIVAKDLQQTLVSFGYDAFAIASSAEEAIARASEKRPDVALMDIRIKGQRDGIETAAILTSQFGIPIIYLTAHADDSTMERAKKTGYHAYLMKPVKPAELRTAIELSVYRYAMERQLREQECWLSTLVRSTTDAVIAVDQDGCVISVNSAAEALLSAATHNAVGQTIDEVLQVSPNQPSTTPTAILARALAELQPIEFEGRIAINAGVGSARSITGTATPVADGDRRLGTLVIFRER